MSQNKLQAVLGITGGGRRIGGFDVSMDHAVRVDLPELFKVEDIERMRRDCEGMALKLRDHPKEMAALFHACLQKDLGEARALAKKLGVTEDQFIREGGGLVWLLMGAVVLGMLLYSTDAD